MRLSVIKDDPGFISWVLLNQLLPRQIHITLNGVFVQEVVTADEERGEVLRIARDEWGDYIIDGDCLAHELVRGVVRIEPNSGSTTGCRPSSDSRTGTGPQPDAGPGSREAGTT